MPRAPPSQNPGPGASEGTAEKYSIVPRGKNSEQLESPNSLYSPRVGPHGLLFFSYRENDGYRNGARRIHLWEFFGTTTIQSSVELHAAAFAQFPSLQFSVMSNDLVPFLLHHSLLSQA